MTDLFEDPDVESAASGFGDWWHRVLAKNPAVGFSSSEVIQVTYHELFDGSLGRHPRHWDAPYSPCNIGVNDAALHKVRRLQAISISFDFGHQYFALVHDFLPRLVCAGWSSIQASFVDVKYPGGGWLQAAEIRYSLLPLAAAKLPPREAMPGAPYASIERPNTVGRSARPAQFVMNRAQEFCV